MVAVGALLGSAAVAAAAVEHARIADAFRNTQVEPLPAAMVRRCGAEPTARVAHPSLAAAFPRPARVVYTAQRRAGPTTIVSGFFRGDVPAARGDYAAMFPPARYFVLRSELDPTDAEVDFGGHGTSGQVKLTQECRERTRVTITVRPD
jgi:hypothetical protein